MIEKKYIEKDRFKMIRSEFKEDQDKYIHVYEGKPRIYPERAKKANKIDLFVMSQCPYGVRAENALWPYRMGSDLEIHYIFGDKTNDEEALLFKKYTS